MIRFLWKPTAFSVIVIALIILSSMVPWHEILFSEQPAELVRSERIPFNGGADALPARVKAVADRKGYDVSAGHNGNGMMYAQIHRQPCLLAVQQMGPSSYQFDTYAVGASKEACSSLGSADVL